MATPARLVLYGNSVFLAGVKAAFCRYSTLEPIMVAPGRPGATTYIQALKPRVVIYERSAAQLDLLTPLLHGRPDVLLIGIDACSDEITILSLHKEHVSSVVDLIRVIRQQIT